MSNERKSDDEELRRLEREHSHENSQASWHRLYRAKERAGKVKQFPARVGGKTTSHPMDKPLHPSQVVAVRPDLRGGAEIPLANRANKLDAAIVHHTNRETPEQQNRRLRLANLSQRAIRHARLLRIRHASQQNPKRGFMDNKYDYEDEKKHLDRVKETLRGLRKPKTECIMNQFEDAVTTFRSLTEGSLGKQRTARKVAYTLKRAKPYLTVHSDEPKADQAEKFKRWAALDKTIDTFKKKGARGGRWGSKSSPEARTDERELAADYSKRHAEILDASVRGTKKERARSTSSASGYAFHPDWHYDRMRKHADSQGTRHPGDSTGVGRTTRLDRGPRRELKALEKAKRRLGPTPQAPAVVAAATKERLKKNIADRKFK